MSNIIIYSKDYCPYCDKAKRLLDHKKLTYKEIDITNDAELYNEFILKANGRKTVPQIFIGNYHVGGCDDLYSLEESNKLDELIKQHNK